MFVTPLLLGMVLDVAPAAGDGAAAPEIAADHRPSISNLARRLQDPRSDPSERVAAVRALGRQGSRRALTPLKQAALSDPDPTVRQAAADACADLSAAFAKPRPFAPRRSKNVDDPETEASYASFRPWYPAYAGYGRYGYYGEPSGVPCYGYDPTYYFYRRLARRQYSWYRRRCYGYDDYAGYPGGYYPYAYGPYGYYGFGYPYLIGRRW